MEVPHQEHKQIHSNRGDTSFVSIAMYANKDVRWAGRFWFTGRIEIIREDIAGGICPILCRAHPAYRVKSWFDWGLFHFSGQDDYTLCADTILGFVGFKTPEFPIMGLVDKWGSGTSAGATTHTIYVAAGGPKSWLYQLR